MSLTVNIIFYFDSINEHDMQLELLQKSDFLMKNNKLQVQVESQVDLSILQNHTY